jgi:methylmalonyl-CoA/ethylmalonyl-CoA epimerase
MAYPPDSQNAVGPVGIEVTFDHVAVAADRIRDLLPLYQTLLKGRFLTGGDSPETGYRAIQLECGGATVELLEPLPGSTFLDTFLARGAGIHHLTFMVDDVESAIASIRGAGLTPIAVSLDDPDWQEAFLHPRETGGTLIQLSSRPRGPSPAPNLSLADVLAGRGRRGTGVASL